MTTSKRFTFDHPGISHLLVDEVREFVWIAFKKDSDGICHLKKVSVSDFNQVYFDVEIEATSLVDVKLDSTNGYIYVLYPQPSTRILSQYSVNNPFTNVTHYTTPYGIPTPIEMTIADNIYVLVGDSSGGVNGKILSFSSGSYNETINLGTLLQSSETLYEISSITSDANDNLWIVTYTNPVKLVRVWFASGGWNMHQTSIS